MIILRFLSWILGINCRGKPDAPDTFRGKGRIYPTAGTLLVKQVPTAGKNRKPSSEAEDLLDLPVVRAIEFQNWQSDWFDIESKIKEPPSSVTSELGSDDRRFLEAVTANPGRKSSAYPKIAKMSSKKALKVRKRLKELGYLREEWLSEKRGRPSIRLVPTLKASNLH